MRKILINTPHGQYTVPLSVIADNRAMDYVKSDVDPNDKAAATGLYNDEYKFVMEDDYEGLDWLMNNMDWKDIEAQATKVNSKVLVTEDKFWVDSEDFKIING